MTGAERPPTLSERFAQFAVGLRSHQIPLRVRELARLHVLDTLGSGIAGSCSNEAINALEAVRTTTVTADDGTPVWGTPAVLPPPGAAFVNGVASHAFELDDSGGCDHSGAVVVPAAFAALDLTAQSVTVDELTLAVVLGYELGRRVQTALGGYDAVNEQGWHSTGVCGTFAAAIAASRLLGLDAEQTTAAIGLAGSFTGGTWAFTSDGAMSKRMHVGRAAEAGLSCAVLARQGFTGPREIFEADWGGFLSLYGGEDADPAGITRALGSDWQIALATIKPHASCRSTHSAIDALQLAMETNGWEPSQLKTVRVRTSSLIADMCGTRNLDSLISTQLSMPFALATAALTGHMTLAEITRERRARPEVAAMMDRVELVIDADQQGASVEPILEITTTAGDAVCVHGTVGRGGSENPLPDSEIVAKFASLAKLRLADEAVCALIELLVLDRTRPADGECDAQCLAVLLRTAGMPELIS